MTNQEKWQEIIDNKFIEWGRDPKSLEDDMVIPVDTIPRLLGLLADGADVGYALCALRHGAQQWSAFDVVDGEYGHSISDDQEKAERVWGTVQDVAGVGMFCTAIKRRVLEAFPFEIRGSACNDWYFSLDCQERGFIQRCDLGLICGHMTMEPSPMILWPQVPVQGKGRRYTARREYLGRGKA